MRYQTEATNLDDDKKAAVYLRKLHALWLNSIFYSAKREERFPFFQKTTVSSRGLASCRGIHGEICVYFSFNVANLLTSLALNMASGYNQSVTYGQPSYSATTGALQNGVQQQYWSESGAPSSQFAAQSQMAQQMNGQQVQQPYAQQVYGQQMQGVQTYGQQLAQPSFGQQNGFGQVTYVQQMPGQQIIQAPAAVVDAQYCAQGEQIFFVNEKWASLSRDDFSILDSNKQRIYKMDSSAFSVTQKRVLKTAKGQAVCSLKKKVA